jgi:hypothetical protein
MIDRYIERENKSVHPTHKRVYQLVICLLTYACHQFVESCYKLLKPNSLFLVGRKKCLFLFALRNLCCIIVISFVYLDKQSKDNVLGHRYTISHLAFSIFFLACICVDPFMRVSSSQDIVLFF